MYAASSDDRLSEHGFNERKMKPNSYNRIGVTIGIATGLGVAWLLQDKSVIAHHWPTLGTWVTIGLGYTVFFSIEAVGLWFDRRSKARSSAKI